MAFPATLTNAVDGVTEIVAAHLNNLEAKVGVDNSAVSTSLDYLLKNVNSIDPGHKHSKLWAADGDPEAVIVDANGKVGIGTTAPGNVLDVRGVSTTTFTTNPSIANLYSTDSYAQDMGGGIYFGGKYNSSGSSTVFAYIGGLKENGTDGNSSGKLVFGTRVHGGGLSSLARMIITSAGNIGIGTENFGTSAAKVAGLGAGTAPSTSPADMFQMYAADIAAGHCAPHFRTELGAVVKLYQQAHIVNADGTLADITTKFNGLLAYLENLGFIATS